MNWVKNGEESTQRITHTDGSPIKIVEKFGADGKIHRNFITTDVVNFIKNESEIISIDNKKVEP